MNATKKIIIKGCLLFIIAVTIPRISSSQSNPDEALIQNILQEETTAWNAGDATLYSSHFADDGTFTNILGQFFVGHQVFMERHEQIFKTVFKGTKLESNIVSLRFIKPDVAIVETIAWVSGVTAPPPGAKLDAKGRLAVRLLQVMMKQGADWKIVAYHNIDIKPGIPVPEPK